MSLLIRSYLWSVRRRLRCSRATKARLCAPLAASLSAFAEETPELTRAMLVETFGASEETAASLQKNVPPEEKKAALRLRTACCIFFLLAFVCITLYAVKLSHSYREPIYKERVVTSTDPIEVEGDIGDIIPPPDEYW